MLPTNSTAVDAGHSGRSLRLIMAKIIQLNQKFTYRLQKGAFLPKCEYSPIINDENLSQEDH